MKISFYASSIVSAYWNGAATYYRGMVKSLNKNGHDITFFEPDAYDRQKHRDITDPDYAKIVVYQATEEGLQKALSEGADADLVIKASGVGIFDEELEREVLERRQTGQIVAFWDVDAPATLDRVNNNTDDPFLKLIPQYDYIFTYGGGQPVIDAYKALGAQNCHPIYNGLDPETHFPVSQDPRFAADLVFLGNRLPDREARVEEFFLEPAKNASEQKFILGGNGWHDKPKSPNINYLGHVSTNDHNALNCSPKAVLNISRESMARYGFSPATRVFEAAGAGACIITDYWEGIEQFFEVGKEILVARSGEDVVAILNQLSAEQAREIGAAAYKKVISAHTYDQRVKELESILSPKEQLV